MSDAANQQNLLEGEKKLPQIYHATKKRQNPSRVYSKMSKAACVLCLWRFLVLRIMGFFNSAVGTLQTVVIALGAGLGVWGIINLLEGYGNDNPGAKSQGMKQLMAGGGVALIGTTLIPLLSGLF
jgi:hypothetical protein